MYVTLFFNDKNKYELSALSQHAFESHRNDFNMSIFKLGIVKRVGHNNLNREEEFYISKFRTNTFGLNRMYVAR